MNKNINYQVIEVTHHNQPALQTVGLHPILGLEFSIALVIPKSIALGMLHQMTEYIARLSDLPSLFTHPWIPYIFEENTTLCILPFVLLEEQEICFIIVPDSKGLYPWQVGCDLAFVHQTHESILLGNLLSAIKASFLSQLMRAVAYKVYSEISIDLESIHVISFEELPDYLAESHLDLWIVLTLCFNKTMPQINQYILKSCESIELDLMTCASPITQAHTIAHQISNPLLVEHYSEMIIEAFNQLSEL